MSFGQMFSVYNQPEKVSTNTTSFRIGTAITSFAFQADPAENPNSELMEVDTPVLVLGLESAGFQANGIIGNRFTGLKDASFFDLNLRFTNSFLLNRGSRIEIGIPIQLATGITTSNNDFVQDRFNQTIFAGGSGATLKFNIARKIRFEADGIAGYGFSNSNGGFFGGSLFYMNGKARFNILNIIGNKGLSIGYDYSLKSFDIDVDTYDFDLNAHLITIVITL